MKETIQDLLTRRSIRKYKKEQVADAQMEEILRCGTYAPTAKGEQSPLMVVVQDAGMLQRLSKMNAAIWGKDTDPFYGAPTAVFVFAQAGNPNSVQDASLVMGNLMNAAHALGVDSCWINRAREMFASEEGKAILRGWGAEGDYEGVGVCILGYGDGEYPAPKARKAGYIIRT